jgi:hypothetical protein
VKRPTPVPLLLGSRLRTRDGALSVALAYLCLLVALTCGHCCCRPALPAQPGLGNAPQVAAAVVTAPAHACPACAWHSAASAATVPPATASPAAARDLPTALPPSPLILSSATAPPPSRGPPAG